MRGLNEKRREVIEDMGSFASGELMGLLKDPETNWQPQDWLPDPSRDDFLDQVRRRFRSFVEAGTNLESRILNLHSFKLISSDATRAGLGLGLGCDVDGRREAWEQTVDEGTARWRARVGGYASDSGDATGDVTKNDRTERLTEFFF